MSDFRIVSEVDKSLAIPEIWRVDINRILIVKWFVTKHCLLEAKSVLNFVFQVLDAGYLKEFNEPYNLLRCRNSLLYQLVAQTGHAEAQKLFDIARKKYLERHPKKVMPSDNPEEEMGALEQVEQYEDEGVELKSEGSNGDSEGKRDETEVAKDKSEEANDAAAEEEKGDDEKAQLLVGFKPEGKDEDDKDDKA